MKKQKRNALETKEKILLNARELFSKKGFDATTVEDIAKHSGINKAMVYYYFSNKAMLYNAVMSGLFDAIYQEVLQAKEIATSVEDELYAFVKTYAIYAHRHPYFPALWLRELSDNGAHLPQEMFASMRKLYSLLCIILQKGEEQKVFYRTQPMVIHFMIVGTLSLLVTTESLRKQASELESALDTCSECSIESMADTLYTAVKKSLERI